MPVADDAAERARVVARVRGAVRSALAGHADVVVAVSGGRDSVVLLDAAVAVAFGRIRVATFDHATGPAATAAVRHVRRLARAVGVPVIAGRARAPIAPTEDAWRVARWRFLRRVAARGVAAHPARAAAVIATGHTADDQLETVVMRLLRGTGARGLAAMYAPRAGVVRPLLEVGRDEIAAYAAARGLTWVEDPSNRSRRLLRNRVRHELLPALATVDPGLPAALLAAARCAAGCRRELDAVAAALAAAAGPASVLDDAIPVAPLAALGGLAPDALAELWPALAARAGLRLDRRGTARVTAFTIARAATLRAGGVPGGAATLAGGATVAVDRVGAAGSPAGSPEWRMVVRPGAVHRSAAPVAVVVDPGALDGARDRVVRFGAWRLRAGAHVPAGDAAGAGGVAWLAADRRYLVRAWAPGDRWRAGDGGPARRVKRFLAEARVPAPARAAWPVVVALGVDAGPVGAAWRAPDAAGGEIVWVPGVRRSSAAPARPGQPGFYLHCERTPERRRGR